MLLATFAWVAASCSSSSDDDPLPEIKVESLRFGQETYEAQVGDVLTPELWVKIEGQNEVKVSVQNNRYGLKLASANNKVAFVEQNGQVKAFAAGETQLVATTPYWNGKAVAQIVVKAKEPEQQDKVTAFRFAETAYSTTTPELAPVLMVAYNDGAEQAYHFAEDKLSVKLSVDAEDIASVSAAGKVTFKKEGKIVLTAMTSAYAEAAKTTIEYKTASASVDCTGEWVLRVWNSESGLNEKVYVALNKDMTFLLYQNVNNLGYETFDGSYELKNEEGKMILKGRYSNGSAWGDKYEVKVNGDTMILTGVKTKAVSEYERTTIPDYVKNSTRTVSEIVPFL